MNWKAAFLSTFILGAVLAPHPTPAAPREDRPAPAMALPAFGDEERLSAFWELDLLPGQKFPATDFAVERIDGRPVLRIRAASSFGSLTHRFEDPGSAGRLSWSWQVESFAEGADLREKRGDDNAIKVCAFFDLPLGQVPFWDRFLLKKARGRTKEDLPSATVCYAWDPAIPAGTQLDNPFSRRLRYLILRSGPGEPGRTPRESRDLGRDFLDLFPRESRGVVPPLLGISVGADSDNTGGKSLAWIADLRHEPAKDF